MRILPKNPANDFHSVEDFARRLRDVMQDSHNQHFSFNGTVLGKRVRFQGYNLRINVFLVHHSSVLTSRTAFTSEGTWLEFVTTALGGNAPFTSAQESLAAAFAAYNLTSSAGA